MEVHQICQLDPGAPVWVWVVRVGKGRWWPGTVLSIAAREPFPIINTRFECRSVGKNGSDGPTFVGISTTRMRYLELRDPNLKGDDRPNFVPSAILAKPEETEVRLNGTEHLEAMTADEKEPREVPPAPVKKSHREKKREPQIPFRMQLSSRVKPKGNSTQGVRQSVQSLHKSPSRFHTGGGGE